MRIFICTLTVTLFAMTAAAQCDGGGALVAVAMIARAADTVPPECMSCFMLDPIVINLSEAPWRLAGLNDPVQFDAQAIEIYEYI
jgi:hypothetical protein